MAGEIQLNSTTFATESAGAITVSNVNSATNRTNLGLGSIATQASNSIDIDGGAIDGTTIGGSTAAAGSFTDLQFNSGFGSVATAYGCRAWVNFNGTGTVSIRESGNVSSITDNGTGDYTINFTTAMPDANYSWCFSTNNERQICTVDIPNAVSYSGYQLAGSLRVNTPGVSGSVRVLDDHLYVAVQIFR